MRMEPRIGPAGRDDEVTRALRALHAPAGGEAFWEGLERRILARVTNTDDDIWWRQFSRWRRELAAYREIELSTVAPVQVASETEREASRDVTLRYVVGP